MNQKYNKDLFSIWLNKTDSKDMNDALTDDDVDKATLIFIKAFKNNLVEQR